VTVIPDKDVTEKKNNVKARDIIWEKRNADYLKFDGCYVLRTDLVGMTDQEIWKTYMMLTRVENAFRCLKSSLGYVLYSIRLNGVPMPTCLSPYWPIIFCM